MTDDREAEESFEKGICPQCRRRTRLSFHALCPDCERPVAGPGSVTDSREHPEDSCGRCGGVNVSWSVDSDRFNMAVYRGEIVCPVCFVKAHEEATGMFCTWELVPATPFRWIEDEGRETPFLRRGYDAMMLDQYRKRFGARPGGSE